MQTKIIVKASFQIGKAVLIKMEPASTLDVENSLSIEDLVWLTLNKGSSFQINPTSGGQATITSSLYGITQVRKNGHIAPLKLLSVLSAKTKVGYWEQLYVY